MRECFTIKSNLSEIEVVEDRLFHFCGDYNVGNYYSALAVATRQAVENAIVHGNGCDEEKEVEVVFDVCRGGIAIEVEDQGDGFDFSKFGSLPEAGMSGEGIFLMTTLANDVRFEEGGRKVHMEFFVSGIDPADAMERVSCLERMYDKVLVG